MTRDSAPMTLWRIFVIFLGLGLTSFGGPIAHLGYFREAFVVRRRWLSEDAYADLIALCQFLPGPASSQAGFALGVSQRGLAGGLSAWAGFTLPSALALFAFAQAVHIIHQPLFTAALHGLKLVAVAVVAQALWGMARTLTPDGKRIALAVISAAIVLLASNAWAQIAAIIFGAVSGLILCRDTQTVSRGTLNLAIPRRVAIAALCLFFALLFALPVLALLGSDAALFAAFYRAGALVFGGGHVVLPLLSASVVDSGWMTNDVFLAGYGAAQAVPGPLFTIAAYLGALLNGPAGAALALVAVFLPGLLILIGTLPFWDAFRNKTTAQSAMRGANAAVVGILAAALYDPLWTSAILDIGDIAIAAAGFALLVFGKVPSLAVVVLVTLASVGLTLVS
jgi:chromate transporter